MPKTNTPKEGNGFHSGRRHPKPEKVQVAKADKSAYKKAVDAQNTSLLPDNSRVLNVISTNSGKTRTNTAK